MKMTLNADSYLILDKDGESVKLGIKTKEGRSSTVISASLHKAQLDKIIAELILLRTRINYVGEKEEQPE